MKGSQNSQNLLNVQSNVDSQYNERAMAVMTQTVREVYTLVGEQAKQINLLLTTLNNVIQPLQWRIH
jgi:hypothetical protein